MLGHDDMVLASAVVTLAAVDVPFPVELTALAMVGLVLRWALGRQNRAHDEHDRRIADIERELDRTRADKDTERHLKHAWRREVTAMRMALLTMLPLARGCTCGTMDPLLPVLERLATETKEPT